MSRAVVIYCSRHALRAVVADGSQVEAIVDLPIDDGIEVAEKGRRLATALAPHSPARAEVLVAVGRAALDSQHLSLPPCPADDLPELVKMQVSPDAGAAGGETRLDFLPLVGDRSIPHQVLAIALSVADGEKLQALCHAADLKPSRIVPLAVGWPAWAAAAAADSPAGATIFVAPLAEEPCVWATIDDRVVLFRQVRLAKSDDPSTLASALAAEMRRTTLALSQQHPEHKTMSIRLLGAEQGELAALSRSLEEELAVDVQTVEPARKISPPDGAQLTSSLLPLVGLALGETAGRVPLVDLLNPRCRPAPRSRRQTYLLAASAAAVLVGMILWLGYAALQAPLDAAAAAEEQLAQVSNTLESFRDDEKQADALDAWTGKSLNVLLALDELSSLLRTEALDAETFPKDQDTVVKRLDVAGRQIVINGHTRSGANVQQLELRLREKTGRVQRKASEPGDEAPGYPWHYEFVVDVAPPGDVREGAAK